MLHRRHGDLLAISRKPIGRCHLCHGNLDLATYGPVHVFLGGAATVDHMDPPSFGGDNHEEAMLLAHHGCNSSRGNGDIEEARLARPGTARSPLSWRGSVVLTHERCACAGHAFAQVDERGSRKRDEDAARWGGFVGLLLSAAL